MEIADQREETLLSQYTTEIEAVLGHARTDPALTAAARAHLAGQANPLGAAVTAAALDSYYSGHMTVAFVDSWLRTYGLSFAVKAFVERCDITFVTSAAHGNGLGSHQPNTWYFDQYRLTDAAKRLRALLASAGDADYEAVVTALAAMRTTPSRRMIGAYLVPTRLDWVAECCVAVRAGRLNSAPRDLLLRSLGSPEQVELLGGAARLTVADCYYVANLITLAEGVGPAIAPLLAEAFDRFHDNATRRKGLLEVLGRLPSDEAFRLMLERLDNAHMRPALRETMRRYPTRAIRMLALAAIEDPAGEAAELLVEHVRANPELVAEVLPELPGEVATVVAKLSTDDGRVPDASADELPPLLVDPPWAGTASKPKPVVLKGLAACGKQAVAWAPGERDTWLETAIFNPYEENWYRENRAYWDFGNVRRVPLSDEVNDEWRLRIARLTVRPHAEDDHWMLAMGPDDLIRPVLRGWEPSEWERPGYRSSPENYLKVLIARFELDALPVVLRFARAKPIRGADLLLPFLDGEVANVMADWLLRVKTVRPTAVAWFARHGRAALPYLLPVALGRTGRGRTTAEYAVLFLAAQEGKDAVRAAARDLGEPAVAAVETLLAGDLEALLPRRKIPADLGVEAAVLPQVLVRGGRRALPASAVRHLLVLLAISTPEEPDPGLTAVKAACDERSMAAFGWALFRHWRDEGASPSRAWQFMALGWLGDDDTVRRLTPLIRAWPGEGGHHHAVRGLEVLTLIGSDLALRELHAIAQKAKFQGLKKAARERVERVGASRGLTADELGDRLVPDFGLDATGALVLDYGPRRFVVGFDEALKPYVADENGLRRASLPKPGPRDDAVLAPAAYQRFTDLKKDVRAIANLQLRRLESAMVVGRRWNLAEFRELFVKHPLVWHMARRLVWIAEDGAATVAFRLAEDHTFASVTDDTVALPEDARIGIAHPLHLGDDLNGWSRIFADYEIAQPFPQFGRAVYALTAQESASARLARFEKVTVPFSDVLALERHGWHRGPIDSDGGISCFVRPVPGNRYIVVSLETGILVSNLSDSEDQTIEAVWIGVDPAPQWCSHPSEQDTPQHTFGDLDPVTASEILADLTTTLLAADRSVA